jgi:hypothetical protein
VAEHIEEVGLVGSEGHGAANVREAGSEVAHVQGDLGETGDRERFARIARVRLAEGAERLAEEAYAHERGAEERERARINRIDLDHVPGEARCLDVLSRLQVRPTPPELRLDVLGLGDRSLVEALDRRLVLAASNRRKPLLDLFADIYRIVLCVLAWRGFAEGEGRRGNTEAEQYCGCQHVLEVHVRRHKRSRARRLRPCVSFPYYLWTPRMDARYLDCKVESERGSIFLHA